MNPDRPSRFEAAKICALLSLLFVGVYGTCNWFTAQRSDVGTWFFAWERHIPFLPLMIVPYMSIDLFFIGGPFLCRRREELRTFARRVAFAIVAAGVCFLLVPLRFAFDRPQTSGWLGAVFNVLYGFDQPHNLFPSLHITLRTILADLYARHTKGVLRLASHVWFSLIGLSTVFTYQHHVVDVIGGFALATVCFYLFREERLPSPGRGNLRVGACYAAGAISAAVLAFAAWPWTAILSWPALAMGIVAAGYFGLGPAVYRKSDGRLPLSACVLLGPCLLGQWLSLRYYRRHCAAWDEVTPQLWIGARLAPVEAEDARRRGAAAVIDLTAEFSESPAFRDLHYLSLPVLDLTAPTLEQLGEAVDFIATHAAEGIVFVHCKVGYSRSAAVVGAWLLASGQAADADQAVRILRQARPSIVLRPEVFVAWAAFPNGLMNPTPRNPGQ